MYFQYNSGFSISITVEENALNVWYLRNQIFCGKPTQKLRWTWQTQLCWTDLLQSRAAFIKNWSKNYKV